MNDENYENKLVKILKVFLVAVVASLGVSGVGAFLLYEQIMGATAITLNLNRVSTAAQLRREAEKIDVLTSEINLIDNSLVRYEVKGNSLETKLSELNTQVSLQTEEINTKYDLITSNLVQKYSLVDAGSLEADVGVAIEMLAEMSVGLAVIRMRVNELEFYQTETEVGNVADVTSVGVCPKNVINRAEHLPRLRRAIENTPSRYRGTHDILVRFDITQEGNTTFKNIESSTASNNLLGAVRQYVDALVFEKPNNSFANCEMIVKLNIN